MKILKNNHSKSKGMAPVYKYHLWPLAAAEIGNPLICHLKLKASVDKKGPHTKPDKLKGGLRGGFTNSETKVTTWNDLK